MDTASEGEKAAVETAQTTSFAETPKVLLQPDLVPKKSRKEEKMQKKDDKIVEHFLKSISNIASTEEKFNILCKKYAELVEETRRLKASINQSDKKNAVLSKEKEQLQLEYNRTVLVKSKLENLCRELQKQNKSIKDESFQKIREEEDRRKETQAKFQATLAEITSLLQLNNEKNTKLREDNINMTNKFKSVVEQYELREQQVDKMAKQMSLEQQLADAKLAKANLEAQAERERIMSEMAHLKLELSQYQARVLENQATEASLRGQIAIYTEKYDEFQNALMKSNKVFGGFKEEMDKMSKKIVKLEKESLTWKKKWEASQVALLEMATDKQSNDGRTFSLEKQVAQLQKLCRTMQVERTTLLDTLKTAGITPPPLPAPVQVPAPLPPPPQNNDRVDAMAANCAQLKQSLAQLQSQLNVLTNKNGTAQEENSKAEKSKKGKGKKKGEKRDKAEDRKSVEPDIDVRSNLEESGKEDNEATVVEDKISEDLKKDEKEADNIDANKSNIDTVLMKTNECNSSPNNVYNVVEIVDNEARINVNVDDIKDENNMEIVNINNEAKVNAKVDTIKVDNVKIVSNEARVNANVDNIEVDPVEIVDNEARVNANVDNIKDDDVEIVNNKARLDINVDNIKGENANVSNDIKRDLNNDEEKVVADLNCVNNVKSKPIAVLNENLPIANVSNENITENGNCAH